MFQEMCSAIISLVLVATAGVYPEAHLQEDGCEYSHTDIYLPTNLLYCNGGKLFTKLWNKLLTCLNLEAHSHLCKHTHSLEIVHALLKYFSLLHFN